MLATAVIKILVYMYKYHCHFIIIILIFKRDHDTLFLAVSFISVVIFVF